jgi:NADPH:quinone reductase
VPAHQAIPVPDDLPDEQVASFFVNPATAWVLIRDVLRVPRRGWVLQTAAGSALGRMIIRLGRHDGFSTLNVVRRREQVEELLRLGADQVVVSGTGEVVERSRALTAGKGVPFGLDAVGGDTGQEALTALGPRGRLIVYGALSMQPTPVDPRSLIVGSKSVEGFWLKDWIEAQGLLKKFLLMRRLVKMIRSGILATPVGEVFPLERVQEAVRAAEAPGRAGKVLLRIGHR